MTPTNKLRFVERLVPASDHPDKVIRVLQQWWSVDDAKECIKLNSFGEWRDVPLEVEK